MGVGTDEPDLGGALAAARSGQVDGFEALYRWLQPPLLRYLTVADPRSAEDVAAQVWLEVSKGLRRFRGDPEAFRGWVFTLGRRRVLDEARRRGRCREVPVAAPAIPEPGTARAGSCGGDVVYQEVLQAQGTAWALGLLASLPPDQAHAVALRVIAGMDVAQAAAVLGKRPGAVRVATHRGLATLRTRLAVPAPRDGTAVTPARVPALLEVT